MLTNKVKERVELPHEPGQWIELRKPSLSILEAVQAETGEIAQARVLLQHCIVAWSYPDPCTAENIAELDTDTAMLLVTGLFATEPPEAIKNAARRSIKP